MRRQLRPSDFPLVTRLFGGRVNHMALQLPANARVKTACGTIALPTPTDEQHVTCQGCILAFAADLGDVRLVFCGKPTAYGACTGTLNDTGQCPYTSNHLNQEHP